MDLVHEPLRRPGPWTPPCGPALISEVEVVIFIYFIFFSIS